MLLRYSASNFSLTCVHVCKLHNDCQHSILCTRNSLLNVMPSIIHHRRYSFVSYCKYSFRILFVQRCIINAVGLCDRIAIYDCMLLEFWKVTTGNKHFNQIKTLIDSLSWAQWIIHVFVRIQDLVNCDALTKEE